MDHLNGIEWLIKVGVLSLSISMALFCMVVMVTSIGFYPELPMAIRIFVSSLMFGFFCLFSAGVIAIVRHW